MSQCLTGHFTYFKVSQKSSAKQYLLLGILCIKNRITQFNCLLLKQLLYWLSFNYFITAWAHQTI
jgi:hypothetical protein